LPTIAEFSQALLGRVPFFCAMLGQQERQQPACTHVIALISMSSEWLQFSQL